MMLKYERSSSELDDDKLDGQSPVIMLVTANVGSLFEDPEQLLQQWAKQLFDKISQSCPQFIALHLQEVGGKSYARAEGIVRNFISHLIAFAEANHFFHIRAFIDEDFHCKKNFTALGSIYFIHERLSNVQIWNFVTHGWELAVGKNINTGNIEEVPTKDKAKFPQEFFPEVKSSRKGFMRTRWQINGTVLELVNVHLFHDASNIAAIQRSPSIYTRSRQLALLYTLKRLHGDEVNGSAPYFIFGDFNFRCDTDGVIKELTNNTEPYCIYDMDDTKICYNNAVGSSVLTLGKKQFLYSGSHSVFAESWLKMYDKELELLANILYEQPIEFPPSYPFKEDSKYPNEYMSTRCPSWCDRVLFSPEIKEVTLSNDACAFYGTVGSSTCMGDHKPICLITRLLPNCGTLKPKEETNDKIKHIFEELLKTNSTPKKRMMYKKRYVKIKPIHKLKAENQKGISQNVNYTIVLETSI